MRDRKTVDYKECIQEFKKERNGTNLELPMFRDRNNPWFHEGRAGRHFCMGWQLLKVKQKEFKQKECK